jgi:CubicO group peptidase (beta-lactamase class C family)
MPGETDVFRAMARCASFTCLLLAGWVALACVNPAWSAPWPTAAWPESTPEAQGVDSAALRDFHEAVSASGARVDSVLLIRNGQVLSEVYFAPYRAGIPHDLRSVTKTVIGMLVGTAIQKHDLRSIDQRVMEHLPTQGPRDVRRSAMTIRHLLAMRAGIQWREWPYDSNSDVLRMAASPTG